MNTNEPNYVNLIKYDRNGICEQIHQGLILHINKNKILNKIGNDNNYNFFHRSCMKPLQYAVLIDLGLDEIYNFSPEEIAVGTGSHAGDVIHQQMVLSVLEKIGLTEENLLCPPIEPLSKAEIKRLNCEHLPFRKVHNNCSGKHSAMLAVCNYLHYDISDYNEFNHPLTKLVTKKVCELCEIEENQTTISKDGCTLPVLATPLFNLGKGFLNLFCNKKYEKIKNAFLQHPFLIGGDNRFDTDIIKYGKDIIAKAGAGGLCVIVNFKKEEALVAKIADSNTTARAYSLIFAMEQLHWDFNEKEINNIYQPFIKTQKAEIVGEILPCFNFG